jgi:hypothetical protein
VFPHLKQGSNLAKDVSYIPAVEEQPSLLLLYYLISMNL